MQKAIQSLAVYPKITRGEAIVYLSPIVNFPGYWTFTYASASFVVPGYRGESKESITATVETILAKYEDPRN